MTLLDLEIISNLIFDRPIFTFFQPKSKGLLNLADVAKLVMGFIRPIPNFLDTFKKIQVVVPISSQI
jgi:hypothetical protein